MLPQENVWELHWKLRKNEKLKRIGVLIEEFPCAHWTLKLCDSKRKFLRFWAAACFFSRECASRFYSDRIFRNSEKNDLLSFVRNYWGVRTFSAGLKRNQCFVVKLLMNLLHTKFFSNAFFTGKFWMVIDLKLRWFTLRIQDVNKW